MFCFNVILKIFFALALISTQFTVRITEKGVGRLVSRSTDRGDFMASRKILLLPQNISSFTCDQIFHPLIGTKYCIPLLWPNISSFTCDQISHPFPVTKYFIPSLEPNILSLCCDQFFYESQVTQIFPLQFSHNTIIKEPLSWNVQKFLNIINMTFTIQISMMKIIRTIMMINRCRGNRV